MRLHGLKALEDWMSEDPNIVRIVTEGEVIQRCVSILGSATIGDEEKDEGMIECAYEGSGVVNHNGSVLTLYGMKKNLEEEENRRRDGERRGYLSE